MSNEIKLTVSLNSEDRARIDAIMFNQEKIIDLLQGVGKPLAEPQNAPQAQEAEPVEQVDQTAEKIDDSASQAPEPAPLPDIGDGSEVPAPQIEAAAAEPACIREDLQRKVVELCAAGKKPEVKEIVNTYAERVGFIPEDKLGEVMGKLIALEG